MIYTKKNISVPLRLFADDCVMYNKINSNQDQSEFNSNLQKNSEMVWGMTDGVKLQKVRVRDYNEEKKYSLLRLLTSWEHARTSESL